MRLTCFRAWALALVVLSAPTSAQSGEAAGIQPGQWVRVQTGPDSRGEGLGTVQWDKGGFQVPQPARLVSHDDVSVTIDTEGRRLRLLRPGTEFQGVVATFDDKALEFVGPEPTVLVPLGSIAKMDVRQRKSRKGRGALIGALAGAMIGAIVATGSGSGSNGSMGIDGAAWAAGAGGVAGASVGALVGLLVAPGARWQEDVALTRLEIRRPARSGAGR